MRAKKNSGAPIQWRSPLYTSRSRELTKREIIRDNGKDADGAYRAFGRIDKGISK